jgi:cytochrome P450
LLGGHSRTAEPVIPTVGIGRSAKARRWSSKWINPLDDAYHRSSGRPLPGAGVPVLGSGEEGQMTGSSVAAAPALPPVVPGSFLLGSALDLRRDMPAACERARAECGDAVRFRVGPPGLRRDLYLFFHPDAARRVLAVGAENYRKDNVFNIEVRRVFGNGLLTSQDAEWQRQKRFLQQLFTPRRVAGYADVIGAVVEEHAGQWRARGGGRVDLYDAMTRLTLQIIGRVLFGDDMRQALPVIRSAAPLSGAVNRRATAPLRLPLAVPTPTNRVS